MPWLNYTMVCKQYHHKRGVRQDMNGVRAPSARIKGALHVRQVVNEAVGAKMQAGWQPTKSKGDHCRRVLHAHRTDL